MFVQEVPKKSLSAFDEKQKSLIDLESIRWGCSVASGKFSRQWSQY